MELSNAINRLRQAQPPKPRSGYTQKSVDEAWQLLSDFLEQHRVRIAELDTTDSDDKVTNTESSYKL